MKILLESGADANAQMENKTTLMLVVQATVVQASSPDLYVMRYLLQNGADVNIGDSSGDRPLHLAVAKGSTDLVRVLIENGADVNVQNNSGDTPLHVAAFKGYNEVANLLIEKGSNVLLKNHNGDLASDKAISNNHTQLAAKLQNLESTLVEFTNTDSGIEESIPSTLSENLMALREHFSRDLDFAKKTVHQKGENLKSWIPSLSEQEINVAVRIARSIIDEHQFDGRRPQMQIVNANAIDRDKLVSIFFFDAGDAPAHMINGDSWWVAASAIGKNAGDKDWRENYFIGFNTLVSARVSAVPEQFNSDLQFLVEKWVRHYNFEANRGYFGSLGAEARPIDLDKIKLHYTKFYDKKRNCTWGLAFLLN